MGNNPILHNDPLGDSGIGPLLSRAVAQSNPLGGNDWLGVTAIRGAIVRSKYNAAAAKIDNTSPTRKTERADLKEEYREITPEPYKSVIDNGRPMPGERAKVNDPTVDNVNKTNEAFNDASFAGGVIGTGLVAVGMVQSSYTIANSSQPVKEAATEASGWAGSIYVGGQFATATAPLGPYVSVGAGIVGGVIGFTLGKAAGNAVIQAGNQLKGVTTQYNESSRKEGCGICLLDH